MHQNNPFKIGDVVYYRAVDWAEPERGVVSSLCEDPNFVFVRFKAINGERTPIDRLTK